MRIAALVCLLSITLPFDGLAQRPLFDFHSAFWMNLHHSLHALVRAREPLDEPLPADATATERAQWAAALDFYRLQYGKRSLLFDEELVRIKHQLVAAESGDRLADATLTHEHRNVLEAAAPIYRRHRWVEHDASNKQFIAALQEPLARHGDAIAHRLARTYDATWPARGVRVDVVRDAGPPGNAFTTNNPTHITIGAHALGPMSLELMFHEASHGWDHTLITGVNDAAARLGVSAPRDLWHAIVFFNAGRITSDVLAAAGIRDYTMLMIDGRIFDRPGWHDAIARHWPAFLTGDISRDEAILRIVRELP